MPDKTSTSLLAASSKSALSWATAWLPPLLWAIFIYVLSSQSYLPGFDVALTDFIFKKSAHMFVYAVLYFLVYRAVENSTHKQTKWHWAIAFGLCVFYAGLDELHQYFTPNRYPTVRDIGYDSLGIWIAFLWKYRYI